MVQDLEAKGTDLNKLSEKPLFTVSPTRGTTSDVFDVVQDKTRINTVDFFIKLYLYIGFVSQPGLHLHVLFFHSRAENVNCFYLNKIRAHI